MESSWFAIIVTIALFVLIHIVATVWWASRVNTLLDIVQRNLIDLVSEMKAMKNIYVSKEDFTRELTLSLKDREAMWKKIDALYDKIKGG